MSSSTSSRLGVSVAAVALLTFSAAACGSDTAARDSTISTTRSINSPAAPTGTAASEPGPEEIDPANFDASSTTIDNRYMPLKPGTRYVYRGFDLVDGKRVPHRVDYIVTDLTKVVNGVRTVVIWDRDYSRDQLEEAELTFFAQDKTGNVWELGEYSEVYEGKELAGARGFLVGYVPRAKAGIMMRVDPQPNTPSYAEGYAPAPIYWTDRARISRVGQKTRVPAGSYEDVLVIEEYSAKQADGSQIKYYAPGVGNVLVSFKGQDAEGERLELVEVSRLDAAGLARARAQALEVDQRAKMYGTTPPLERAPSGGAP